LFARVCVCVRVSVRVSVRVRVCVCVCMYVCIMYGSYFKQDIQTLYKAANTTLNRAQKNVIQPNS